MTDPGEVERLAGQIAALLGQGPKHFVEVLRPFRDREYRVFLLAWSRLREEHRLGRDRIGRYLLREPSS